MLMISPIGNIKCYHSTDTSKFYEEHIQLSMNIIKESCNSDLDRRQKFLEIKNDTENSSLYDIIYLNSLNSFYIQKQIFEKHSKLSALFNIFIETIVDENLKVFMVQNEKELEQIFFGIIFSVEMCTIFYHEYVHTTVNDKPHAKKLKKADEEFLCDFQAGTACTNILDVYSAYYQESEISKHNPSVFESFIATTILVGTTLFSNFVVTKTRRAYAKYKKTKNKKNIQRIDKRNYPAPAERRFIASGGAITALVFERGHPKENLISNFIGIFLHLNPDLPISEENVFQKIDDVSNKQYKITRDGSR